LSLPGIAAFVGGHLLFVYLQWPLVHARWQIGSYDTMLYSGLHAGAAIAAAIGVGVFAFRIFRLPTLIAADALTPCIGLCIAIARLGCFLEGCCYGVRCSWPWCISFPQGSQAWHAHHSFLLIPADATWSAPVHPLQLYFSAAGLLVMALATWLHPRRRYDGQVFLVGLAVFAATSAALEGLRGDATLRAYWGQMPFLTMVALGLLAVAMLGMIAAEAGLWWRRRVPRVATST
jgi:phosphatidylglycerol:prolipoprotein diacylglycerol transferase